MISFQKMSASACPLLHVLMSAEQKPGWLRRTHSGTPVSSWSRQHEGQGKSSPLLWFACLLAVLGKEGRKDDEVVCCLLFVWCESNGWELGRELWNVGKEILNVDVCVWLTTFVVRVSCFNMFIFGRSSWLCWVQDIWGFWDCLCWYCYCVFHIVVFHCCHCLFRYCY